MTEQAFLYINSKVTNPFLNITKHWVGSRISWGWADITGLGHGATQLH